MLKEIGNAVKAKIADTFTQIEFYEGQFEMFDEVIVNPPACYIDYTSGSAADPIDVFAEINMTLHVMATSLQRDQSSILDLVEGVVSLLNNKGLNDPVLGYLGRCFHRGFKAGANFPGLAIYEVALVVKRSDLAK